MTLKAKAAAERDAGWARRRGAMVSAALGAIAIGASGCWFAALQLAPVAVEGVKHVGAGAAHVTANATGLADPDPDDPHAGVPELERVERCRQLALELPGVIELRRQSDGTVEYRELQLAASASERRWSPLIEPGTDARGWRPAVNYLRMNFTPPLGAAMADDERGYMAYAPAEAQSWAEQAQLAMVMVNFGEPRGTFDSAGRTYRYALSRKLPCFASPG